MAAGSVTFFMNIISHQQIRSATKENKDLLFFLCISKESGLFLCCIETQPFRAPRTPTPHIQTTLSLSHLSFHLSFPPFSHKSIFLN